MYWLRFGIFLRSGSILRRMSFDIVSPFRRTPKAPAGRSLASTFYQLNEGLSCCHNSVVATMLGVEELWEYGAVFRLYCIECRSISWIWLGFSTAAGRKVSFVETLLIFSAYLRQAGVISRNISHTLLNLSTADLL